MRTLVLALLLLVAAPARAYDLWITSTITSYHFTNPKAYNDANFGLGLAWRVHERIEIIGGAFENSFYRTTAYAGAVGYSKWLELGLGVRSRVGFGGGIATGYQAQAPSSPVHYPNSTPQLAPEPTGEHKISPIALPVLSFERGRFGVDLTGAPKIGPKQVAFIGLGVRFGF